MMKLFFIGMIASVTLCVSGQNAPVNLQDISAENIAQIREISRLDVDSNLALNERIVWSPDGETFAIVFEDQVLLYSASDLSAEPIVLYQTQRIITSATFSTDFELLAVSSGKPSGSYGVLPLLNDPSVAIIEIDTGALVTTFPTEHVSNSMAFGVDNTRLIVVDYYSYDFTVWDVHDGQVISEFETNQYGWGIMFPPTFSDDATLLALGAGNTYNSRTVWDTQTGKLVAEGEYGYSYELTFSPDNAILAGASRYGGSTELWHLDDDHENLHINYNPYMMLASDFSPDGTIYSQIILTPTSADNGYVVEFFTPNNGERLHRTLVSVDTSYTMDMIFSPNRKWLLIYDRINGIQLWGVPEEA
ncbi:MAG: hypothetical protein RLP44_29145 [Aggregatilineales bacterium]